MISAKETNKIDKANTGGLEIWGRPSATIVNTKKEIGVEIAATATIARTLPRTITAKGVGASSIVSMVWFKNSA